MQGSIVQGSLASQCARTAAALLLFGVANAQEGTFLWQDDEHALASAADSLTPAAVAALQDWSPWALEHGYLAALSDDQSVLLLLPERRLPKSTWKRFEKALAAYATFVPELLPAPLTAARDASAGELVQPGSLATGVLVQARNAADYAALIEHAVELEPYLAGWAPDGKRAAGLVLERPLLAAFLEEADGLEEWDPSNELVHRLGALLTLRRFGALPHWLQRGLAWTLEVEVEGDVACFPDREGFVSVAEHGGWPSKAKRLARARSGGVTLSELAVWQRGTWDEPSAVLSWAVTRWLVTERPQEASLLFADLAQARTAGATVHHADGSWETRPGFQLDAAAQAESFARVLGEDYEGLWTAALAGKKPNSR